ncbi:MAG: type II toxin-antitoxin system RelE/ParE family toxin [Acidobacteriota bacterium]|nr:type II toxin-antitoxin system RelE/ParE family toxin [Acidobacteriota bacterium]
MSPAAIALRVLPNAIREVADQAAYYRERADVALALRWRSAVNEAMRSLRTFPERGSPLDSDTPELHDIRRLHIHGFPKHLIFYRFDRVGSVVSIISVLHGSRDVDALLKLAVRE